MLGNMNNAAMSGVSAAPLPDHPMKEIMNAWGQQQRTAINGLQGNKSSQIPGIPGQPGQLNVPGQLAATNNAVPTPGGSMPQLTPQQQQANLQKFLAYVSTPQGRSSMDSMDVPQKVLENISRGLGGLPPDTRKWSQIKQYLSGNPSQNHMLVQIQNVQLQQFKGIWEKKVVHGVPPAGAPLPNGPVTLQVPPGARELPPGEQYPPTTFQVAPGEVEAMRKRDSRLATMTLNELTNVIRRVKMETHAKKAWENYHKAQSQNGNNAATGGQQPSPQVPPTTSQPNGMSQGTPASHQAHVSQHKSGAPAAAPDQPTSANNQQPRSQQPPQPNRSNPPAATPNVPKNSLKRPNPDDGDVQRSVPHPAHRSPGQVPQTGDARLTVDQRAKLETSMGRTRSQPGQPGMVPEDMEKLRNLAMDESKLSNSQQEVPVHMTNDEYQDACLKIKTANHMVNNIIKPQLPQWFMSTKDEARARMFFKARFKMVKQFTDSKQLDTLRKPLTISKHELDQILSMMRTIIQDIQQQSNTNQDKQAQAGAGAAVKRTPQQVPLSEANLRKQTDALKDAQNRTVPKNAQPPPAPTTTQPPLQLFGVKNSPDGHPQYYGESQVTHETLKLPASRKKTKQGGQVSPPAAQSSSPHVKAPSPVTSRKPDPTKAPPPTFKCPEQGCEVNLASEESLIAHRQEEHIKPFEDPTGFLQENMAAALGLDAQGTAKSSLSKQGQMPMVKSELTATPMSRDASMRRSGSGAGATPSMAVVEDSWVGTTIDPQSLFAGLPSALDSVTGNLMPDHFALYRSVTPNDTPESSASKDSGVSEPNSDIAEGAAIDIDLSWQPLDVDLLVDMNNFGVGMDGYEPYDADMLGAESFQFSLEDMQTDFSKPFQMPTDFYSMDASS